MKKHGLLAALVATLALLLSLFSGPHRRAALFGSSVASVTAIASLVAVAMSARTARKPVQSAFLVVVLFFLVRMVLVAIGTAIVARAGENIFVFIAAFFIPYFLFAAIEGAFVHSLGRTSRSAA